MPEACIQQVQNRMLGTADININRKPFFQQVGISDRIFVFRIDIAQIIPAASRPLRHCIGLTAPFFACFRICHIDPLINIGER
ncbi:Uncharacterised protein [Mycobacteroides abscessus subsp. abscessus]|nr:Uncharacterised protein [Mycobacteroides abscessus subsp. abscessus]